jgi:hypothetical protein
VIFGTITLFHYAEFRYVKCHIAFILMLNIIMLSVIILSVITLSVVAPLILLNLRKNISAVKRFFTASVIFKRNEIFLKFIF